MDAVVIYVGVVCSAHPAGSALLCWVLLVAFLSVIAGLCGSVLALVATRLPVLLGWFSQRCVCLSSFLLLCPLYIVLASCASLCNALCALKSYRVSTSKKAAMMSQRRDQLDQIKYPVAEMLCSAVLDPLGEVFYSASFW